MRERGVKDERKLLQGWKKMLLPAARWDVSVLLTFWVSVIEVQQRSGVVTP